MERIQIREAVAEDFEFCLRVRERAFRAYVEAITTWDPEFERRGMEDRFARGSVTIVSLDGVDCAYYTVDLIDGSLWLQNLMVLPEYQSHGVGAFVIRHLRSQPDPVRLRVLRHNIRAVAFYLREGFVPEGESETHYYLVAA
jgi:ribosomal protein S18 acetylase RimI-like enzyme